MNNIEASIHNSVFRIGTVCSVDGRIIKIRVDRDKNTSHLFYKGELIKNVSVGSYIKVLKGFIPIIGKVETEYLSENKIENSSIINPEDEFSRILVVKLIGVINNHKFKRGVTELPLIDNECYLLTNKEFNLIHTFGSSPNNLIQIGHLANDQLIPISFGIGKLFSSHIGIFGNTGSGKSYTLSKLYRQLLLHFEHNDKFKENAKFLFFDFNGEYSNDKTIISNKTVYRLSTRTDKGDKIPITDNDLLDINLLSIFANATEKTQRPFIARCISLYELIDCDNNNFQNRLRKQIIEVLQMSDKVKAELLIDYVEQILLPFIEPEEDIIGLHSDYEFHNNNSYFFIKNDTSKSLQSQPNLIEELDVYKKVSKFKFSNNFISNFIAIMYMRLIYDVLANRAVNEHIAPAINKLKQSEKDINRIFDTSGETSFWGHSNIVVVDLSDVNTDTKKRIPLLLTNKLYNTHKQNHNKNDYLNIIVDEAHNILSYQSTRESDNWKDYRLEVFEEIIKEGRKFGVFMTIASQRPSDISSTIISQLHNYFIHRLVNEKDIEQVNNTISYLDKVSVEMLPILSTGVCIVAGILADMPVVIQVDKIEEGYQPNNETINIEEVWN